MERKDKYADLREATDDELKADFWRVFVEENGEAYAEKYRGLFDAQWEYILTLGFNGRHFVMPDGRVVAESDLDGGLVRRVATKKR